jgi:hypothetical protein
LSHTTANSDGLNAKSDLAQQVARYGLFIHETGGGGDCLFSATAHQLRLHQNLTIDHHNVRASAVGWLAHNNTISMRDGVVNLQNFIMDASWPQYLSRMSHRHQWGDNIVFVAIAHYYQTNIIIISPTGLQAIELNDTDKIIFLAHQPEWHYFSTVPKESGILNLTSK